MELFDTRDEAIAFAEESIKSYLDDTWGEGVDQVCVGCITDQSTETDYVDASMLDDEGEFDGSCYAQVESGEWGHSCNYEMLPAT